MQTTCDNPVSGTRQGLVVSIGGSLYAIAVAAVEEVLPALPLEVVPQLPSFVLGVVLVRGELLSVIDAAERLGMTDRRHVPEPHLLCVRVAGRLIGLAVDEAVDLIDMPEALSMIDGIGTCHGFLSGLTEIDGQIVRILNVERLLAPQEVAALVTE